MLISRAHLGRHRQKHVNSNKKVCPKCPLYRFDNEEQLVMHNLKKHSDRDGGMTDNSRGKCICDLCNEKFFTHYQLAEHKMEVHGKQNQFRKSHVIQTTDNIDVITEASKSEDERLVKELTAAKHFLQPTLTNYKHQMVFNFPIVEESHATLMKYADRVYSELPCAAKVNISFGYVLKSNSDEDTNAPYRYFYAHDNHSIFEKPITVSDRSELLFLMDRLDDEDFFAHANTSRPNTKWRFHMLTNVTFKATLLKKVPLGCKNTDIPIFIQQSRAVRTLLYNKLSKKPFDDNLCMFRAIATHKSDRWEGVEILTAELFEKFLHAVGDCEKRNFRGVKQNEITLLENITDTNINIYSASKNGNDGHIVGEQVRRSLGLYNDTCHLLQVGKHVCYIVDLQSLFKRYKCMRCSKFFTRQSNLHRHVSANCTEKVRNIYPGKVYNLQQTIFEKLDDIGIYLDRDMRVSSNFAVFDFESYCAKEEAIQSTATTEYLGKHIPVSASVCDNFMSTEPYFMHNHNPQQLVVDFLNYLEKLSAVNAKLQLHRYSNVFQQLKDFQAELIDSFTRKFLHLL